MGRDAPADDKWRELSDFSSTSHLNEASPKAQKHRSVQISEATDIFGDLQTAEDYGYDIYSSSHWEVQSGRVFFWVLEGHSHRRDRCRCSWVIRSLG